MFALVGVVLSYATVVAGAPSAGLPAFEDICVAGSAACDAPIAADDSDAVYATPAEINCPAPERPHVSNHLVEAAPAADAQGLFGACSPPVLDFRYRVSRLPESERPAGAFQPQRARRSNRAASCTGLPPEHGTQLSTGFIQPAAVYARLGMIPPAGESTRPGATARRPSRVLEPLDRPPRA